MLAQVFDIREGILKKLNREFTNCLIEMSETAEQLEDDSDNAELKARHATAFEKCNELEAQISVLEEELFGVQTKVVIMEA